MKKIIIVILFLMFILSACKSVEMEKLNSINLDEKLNDSNISLVENENIEIAEGAACSPYSPQGQVLYDFETTSEYPEIEKINEEYRTATFGLG
ncbi:MAG: hypothetical protein WBA54_00005 [Acidaminobacteraceae bacterium]